MTATQKFINALTTYAKHSVSDTAVHASGVMYHYEHYTYDKAPYFMEKLWKAAVQELNMPQAHICDEFVVDGQLYRFINYSKFKGQPPHRVFSTKKLVKH